MTELDTLRKALDDLDQEMVSLFERRMALSRRVAEYKLEHGLPILDASREQRVLQSRADMLGDPALRAPLMAFYEHLMALSRQEQQKRFGKEDAHA